MSQNTLLDLSRWQWALTAAFSYHLPALTVGTALFLSVCYWMYMRTDEDVWLRTPFADLGTSGGRTVCHAADTLGTSQRGLNSARSSAKLSNEAWIRKGAEAWIRRSRWFLDG